MSATATQAQRPVERLAAGAARAFAADFRLRSPVVLAGGLRDWPDTLFDLARLARRCGDEEVLSYRIPGAALSARMSSVKGDFHLWSDGAGDHGHLQRWSLARLVAALQSGEAHYCMANRTKNTRLRDRLAAESGEVDCAPVAGSRHETGRREFFLGSEGAGPGLHHDGAIESLLCQLAGAKRVNLFAPADAAWLYPADAPGTPTGHFSAIADSFHADAERFPLFALSTVHRCRLEPGDILYLPPHWYHDTAPEGPGLSMSIRNAPGA